MKEINNKLILEIIFLYKELSLSLTKIGEKVNLDRHTVSKILTDYGIEYKDFTNVPLEVCIERDSKRECPIGEKIIRDTYNKYLNKN